MQIIPAVDVLGTSVVRLLQGRFDQVTLYGADPVAAARRWMDEGAEMVHVVDLEGARTGIPDTTMWSKLGDAGIPFQVGGGIRSVAVAEEALAIGAERVVLGSAAVWDPDLIGSIVGAHGPDALVAAVDVKAGRATGSGWLDQGRAVPAVLDALGKRGCRWIIVTGVARDGTMHGPDLDLTRRIVAHPHGFRVIASGGVGTIDHLVALAELGAAACVIGRALYDGSLNLADAIAATG